MASSAQWFGPSRTRSETQSTANCLIFFQAYYQCLIPSSQSFLASKQTVFFLFSRKQWQKVLFTSPITVLVYNPSQSRNHLKEVDFACYPSTLSWISLSLNPKHWCWWGNNRRWSNRSGDHLVSQPKRWEQQGYLQSCCRCSRLPGKSWGIISNKVSTAEEE